MLLRGNIHKIILDKLYGFAIDSKGVQYFFHLGDFVKGDHIHQPPPIMGEAVGIEVPSAPPPDIDKAVRSLSVIRAEEPKYISGQIEYYDAANGYGFIRDSNNTAYYLHKSEILDKSTPQKGQKVLFYSGINKGKPRACYVSLVK